MKYFIIPIILLFVGGCKQKISQTEEESESSNKIFKQVTIEPDVHIKTVGIDSYTLITNDEEIQRSDAKAIMEIKRNWPLAMQRKDTSLFESILGKRFTFRSHNEFYNRKEYINDRINSPVTVDTAKYENLTLQFFNRYALLTYRNIVTGKDSTGKKDVWQYSWADMFVKEKGTWKIGASHLIQEMEIE